MWLAKKNNCDRTNIYKIFQRPSIDTALLSRISKALEHDFFVDLSENIKLIVSKSHILVNNIHGVFDLKNAEIFSFAKSFTNTKT